jgi:hypothetical protein
MFVEWSLSSVFFTFSADELRDVLRALRSIAKYVSGCATRFYVAPWQEIDEFLRSDPDLYSKLYKPFMASFKHMAMYRPALIEWSPSLLFYFSDIAKPDSGVAGLEISSIIFRDSPYVSTQFPNLDVCEWLIQEMTVSSQTRQIALLRCLCSFLSFVEPLDEGERYTSLLQNLTESLTEIIALAGISEIVFLSLYLLVWFINNDYCSSEIIEAYLPSLEDIQREVDEASSDNMTPIKSEMCDFIMDRLNKLQQALAVHLPFSDVGDECITYLCRLILKPDANETHLASFDLLRPQFLCLREQMLAEGSGDEDEAEIDEGIDSEV